MKKQPSSRSQLLSIPREGGDSGRGVGVKPYRKVSTIAIVTFAFKAVYGIVWDADSFGTARIYVAGYAGNLLKKKTKTKTTKQQKTKNSRYITRKK